MAKFASLTSKHLKIPPLITGSSTFCSSILPPHTFSFPLFYQYSFPYLSKNYYICQAKKKKPLLEPVLKPSNIEEGEVEEEEEEVDEFEDGMVTDGDDFFEEEEEEDELFVGDGAGGGGISLAGMEWDESVLAIAEDTILSFNGDMKIYAFKTLKNSTIQVRIEKLSNKSGSPSMVDIKEFSCAYRAQLDEAEQVGTIPENLSLEVSSPGVERVVQIPQDLERFKDRPMYVKFVTEATEPGLSSESDGVFKLVSFDVESSYCTWGIADVRINREKAGKGRPLNKKQREWRLNTPFQSLRLVRIYSEF
ncbi:hypothetical protein IFM89_001619 [Coptis chinensis]|uniref:Ribosome maturation factor RimP N-terminal domain-containing protein n=1 Tax=Coptis chinensis TaxID=261450 RepID=A0A835HKC7_9MAGN|nr:hypothetical protein IFM89_001619 [Coptis chinensis]